MIKHILPISDDELKEKYDAGASGPKLAERYGCTTRVIYSCLHRAGYVARPPRGNVNKHLSMSDRELKAEYERGLTTGQLSKQCGCSDETVRRRLKISGCTMRSHKSMEFKILMSTIKQSVHLRDWRGYSEDNPYCEKFDDACKVRNREKYDNQCFICGKDQSDNITTTGKQKALSAHHVDMNKQQGCDDHDWNLIPLCMAHHGPSHTPTWAARIEYLLNHVWGV